MNLTYFPCLSIFSHVITCSFGLRKQNRVVFSLCEIRSLQDYYEFQVANYINRGFHAGLHSTDEENPNDKKPTQQLGEIGALTKIADYQVYHL